MNDDLKSDVNEGRLFFECSGGDLEKCRFCFYVILEAELSSIVYFCVTGKTLPIKHYMHI